jgi:hypothetical protein
MNIKVVINLSSNLFGFSSENVSKWKIADRQPQQMSVIA